METLTRRCEHCDRAIHVRYDTDGAGEVVEVVPVCPCRRKPRYTIEQLLNGRGKAPPPEPEPLTLPQAAPVIETMIAPVNSKMIGDFCREQLSADPSLSATKLREMIKEQFGKEDQARHLLPGVLHAHP